MYWWLWAHSEAKDCFRNPITVTLTLISIKNLKT
jgi:hypothetical protein